MEYPFEVSEGVRPVTARFNLDLLDYSQLVVEYSELTQRRSLVSNTILNAQLPQSAYTSLQNALIRLDERISQIEQSFSSERRTLSTLVSSQQGEVYMDAFSKLLRAEFALGTESEQQYVQNMGTSHSPLVINCLRIYWVELLRYSFDAFIAQSLSPYFQHMNLQVTLSFELLPDGRVHVSMGNNVGGFQLEHSKVRAESNVELSQKRLAFYFGREFQLTHLAVLLEKGIAHTGFQTRRLFDASRIENQIMFNEGSISIISPSTPFKTLTIRDFLQIPLITSFGLERNRLFSGAPVETKDSTAKQMYGFSRG